MDGFSTKIYVDIYWRHGKKKLVGHKSSESRQPFGSLGESTGNQIFFPEWWGTSVKFPSNQSVESVDIHNVVLERGLVQQLDYRRQGVTGMQRGVVLHQGIYRCFVQALSLSILYIYTLFAICYLHLYLYLNLYLYLSKSTPIFMSGKIDGSRPKAHARIHHEPGDAWRCIYG